MNPSPKISVIMAVYNAEKFLREAIESILSQSFSDFEFIIIDDGSTDNSLAIIRSYSDKRIRTIGNSTNNKLPYCLNLGIAEAKGKYIARMDADDLSLPHRLLLQYNFMEANPQIDILGGSIIEFSLTGKKIVTYPANHDEIKTFITIGINPIAHPALFARKSIFIENSLFYKEGIVHEDLELWFRMLKKDIRFANLDSVILKYRIDNPNQISCKYCSERIQMEFDIFREGIGQLLGLGRDDKKINDYFYLFKIKKRLIPYGLKIFKAYFLLHELKKANKKSNYIKEEVFNRIISKFTPLHSLGEFFMGRSKGLKKKNIPRNEKKRVLFLWADLRMGGAEKALLNLAKNLNKSYQLKILLCYNKIEFEQIPEELVIDSIIDNPEKTLKPLVHLKILLGIFFAFLKYDVIIVNELPLLTFFTGILSRILPSKKVVYWTHICKTEIVQSKSYLMTAIIRKILASARNFVCVSTVCKESLKRFLRNENFNVAVIHNLIDEKSHSYQSPSISCHPFRIMGLGRLSKEKRFDLLIVAANNLLSEYKFSNFIIEIAGTGEEKQNLEELITAMALQNYVKLVGFKNNSFSFICQCDLFVSCSDSEALPYNLIEALSCDKPVIVSATGAAQIIEYGKYGVVLEKNNPRELAKWIYKMATNSQLRCEFSGKAHLALDKFNNEKSLHLWIELIEKK